VTRLRPSAAVGCVPQAKFPDDWASLARMAMGSIGPQKIWEQPLEETCHWQNRGHSAGSTQESRRDEAKGIRVQR